MYTKKLGIKSCRKIILRAVQFDGTNQAACAQVCGHGIRIEVDGGEITTLWNRPCRDVETAVAISVERGDWFISIAPFKLTDVEFFRDFQLDAEPREEDGRRK